MDSQELRQQAKDALLEKIAELTKGGMNPALLLHLAEAWAWLEDPSQGHGSGGARA